MKFSFSDLRVVRMSFLALCVSAIVSTAILYGSDRYAENARKGLRGAQTQLNEARNRLTATTQDRENMENYANGYSALLERKIVGDDQRLDWMEGVETIRRHGLVTDFRYSIAPQKSYAPQPPVDSGNFDLRYSEMKLQFDLLHEAQILNFFDELHTHIKGRYLLEGCTLQRAASMENEDGQSNAIQLKAECGGGWITLKNRNAQ